MMLIKEKLSMDTKDILILVKTYPEISRKYTETVCTGGILAETKELIRLYPVRYRYLEGEAQFSKYQWIRAKISKSNADVRPESYNIVENTIKLGDIIDPGKDWQEREKWVLNSKNVYSSLEDLWAAQKMHNTSIGIIKPKEIRGFHIEKKDQSEINEANLKKDSVINQLDMLEDRKNLEIIPVRFVLNFICEDEKCRGHKLSILDWEFAQLYRKVKNSVGWEKKIEEKIMTICSDQRETFLILGNMARWQNIFCIIGFFYPPKMRQRSLF
jgi:hypothetical protein